MKETELLKNLTWPWWCKMKWTEQTIKINIKNDYKI